MTGVLLVLSGYLMLMVSAWALARATRMDDDGSGGGGHDDPVLDGPPSGGGDDPAVDWEAFEATRRAWAEADAAARLPV